MSLQGLELIIAQGRFEFQEPNNRLHFQYVAIIEVGQDQSIDAVIQGKGFRQSVFGGNFEVFNVVFLGDWDVLHGRWSEVFRQAAAIKKLENRFERSGIDIIDDQPVGRGLAHT